jgi:outer membrane lipoprotein-sorting protein
MRMIGRRLSILVLGTALGVLAQEAIADDAACQAVLDAVIKQATIPVHQKISIESATAPGKALQSEMIRTGDTLYMQVRGQWTTRPYDGQKAANDAQQAMQNAEHSCTRVGSEVVDGQAADLYSVEAKTASGGTNSQIWISHASGLPLRQHTVMLEQGSAKGQHDVRFDYSDVRAPQGISR